MKTVLLKANKNNPSEKELGTAAEVLKNGGVIVFPTDTVCGLAAGAFDLKAQKAIYKLKGRSFHKPLILMAAQLKDIENFVELDGDAKKLIKKFWPGPLTLILPTTHLGKMMMGGRKDLGVRIPKDSFTIKLISAYGLPIATTSANVSGKPSAKTAMEALKYFNNKVGLIIDAGKCGTGKESTVIEMVKYPYVVVRKGCVSGDKLLECLSKGKNPKSEFRNPKKTAKFK